MIKKDKDQDDAEFAPKRFSNLIREPLPPKPANTPEEELEELRRLYSAKGFDYFPEETRDRVNKIFALFTKTNPDFATFDETVVACGLTRKS